MTDFRLVAQPDSIGSLTFDWLATPSNLIDETQELVSAVLIALNSDALADEKDVLPDPRDTDRRGWWGDMDAERIWGGWTLGSKLWLLKRAKIVGREAREGSTTARAERYTREALQPFIDAGIMSRVDVSAVQTNEKQIVCTVTIYRGPKPSIQLEFQAMWQALFPGST